MSNLLFIHNPNSEQRLGDILKSQLNVSEWSHLRISVAFAKRSGVRHIYEKLHSFSKRADVKITVGVDFQGTSYEGLSDLLDCLEGYGEIHIFHNENPSTFHPKMYLFRKDSAAFVVIGSGNLTEGGLYTNYEANLALLLDLSLNTDQELLNDIEKMLEAWWTENGATCVNLTRELLMELRDNGYVSIEAQDTTKEKIKPHFPRVAQGKTIFKSKAIKLAPTPVTPSILKRPLKGFVMTLQRTDVGSGQITPGTSPRSPEIFIPLIARDHDSEFWGYPDLFDQDIKKDDRRGVKMKIGAIIISVNMMCWHIKRDFRLRNARLRSAGNIGDIIKIERAKPDSGYDYEVQIIPFGSPQFKSHLALCSHNVRNSKKVWGYY